MTLLNPGAMVFMALLAIPILLSFFRPRPRLQLVGSLFLWREAATTTQTQPSRRLLDPLLWLQLLALGLLIFAAANPVMEQLTPVPRPIILLLDLSPTMRASDRWEQALQGVTAYLTEIQEEALVAMVGVSGQPLIISGFLPIDEALQTLSQVEPGWTAPDWSSSLQLATALLPTMPRGEIIIISDGVHGPISDIRQEYPGPHIRQILVGDRQAENLGVTAALGSIAPLSSQPLALVRVVNYSSRAQESMLTLSLNGRPYHEWALQLTPREERQITMEISEPGLYHFALTEDAYFYDDHAYLYLPPTQPTRVSLDPRAHPQIRRVVASLPHLQITSEPQGADLIIQVGGDPRVSHIPTISLPPYSHDPISLSRLTPHEGEWPLRYLDLGEIQAQKGWPAPEGTPLLSYQGLPILAYGEGWVWWGLDLANSDLPARASFPILITHLIDHLLPHWPSPTSLTLTAGDPLPFRPPAGQLRLEALGPHQRVENLTGLPDSLPPGAYRLSHASGWEARFSVALSPSLSDLRERALTLRALPVSWSDEALDVEEKSLWPPILALALLVLAFEMVLYQRRV